MNTSKDGKIKFKEFRNFCEQFPSAMDFLGRLTIGSYPNATEIEESEISEAVDEDYYKIKIRNQNMFFIYFLEKEAELMTQTVISGKAQKQKTQASTNKRWVNFFFR